MKEQDFSYLKPTEKILGEITFTAEEIFQKEITTSKKDFPYILERNIFSRVEFDEVEISKINELKERLQKKKLDFSELSDSHLLRTLYAKKFDLHSCVIVTIIIQSIFGRLQTIMQQKMSQENKNQNQQTLLMMNLLLIQIILRTLLQIRGIIYLEGRDTKFRPILILNMERLQILQDGPTFSNANALHCAAEETFGFMQHFMQLYYFSPSKIENFQFLFDASNISIKNLPLTIISKFNTYCKTYYPLNIYHMWIYNPPTGFLFTFNALKRILGYDSQNLSFVHFIQADNEQNMKEFHEVFPKHQLEKKYGGLQQDCTTFWPPANTLPYFEKSNIEIELDNQNQNGLVEAKLSLMSSKLSEKEYKNKSSRNDGFCGFCTSKGDSNAGCKIF